MNVGYPDWLTARKSLESLGGGDPNGVTTSKLFQGVASANLPLRGGFIPLRRHSRWLTMPTAPNRARPSHGRRSEMMELREKAARAAVKASGYNWTDVSDLGLCGKWLRLADAILALPEIAEALNPSPTPSQEVE